MNSEGNITYSDPDDIGNDVDDERTLDDLNLELLQTTIDRIIADISRWDQSLWCNLHGDVDTMTVLDLKAGVYHDFTLEPRTIDALKELVNSDGTVSTEFLPVADCGTAFCVAGDVAVATGHTFVAERFAHSAWAVVPTAKLQPFMRGEPDENGHRITPLDVDIVARDELRLSKYHANALFDGGNDIYQVLAVAFLLSQGRLVLPDAVPAKLDRFNETITDSADTPAEVRRAVMRAAGYSVLTKSMLYSFARFIDLDVIDPEGTSHFWDLQLDRLRDIIAAQTETEIETETEIDD